MITVDTIGKVRRLYFVERRPIKAIARDLRLARNTVRSIVRSEAETERHYERREQPRPQLGPFVAALDAMLAVNAVRPARERLSYQRLFEDLRLAGYRGSYDNVRRYAHDWVERHGAAAVEAYVPLIFAPGEAYQFDWSHECVVIDGVTTMAKVAQVRLCHSRMLFVRAYPREAQEMVFDAHEKAFAFFKGVARRGIYDNMRTAVDAVFVGKERQFNRRFSQLMSHHLVEPTACTPAAGWEKGQVENQVGFVRRRLFSPRLKFKSYEELNTYLTDRCVVLARSHPHPEQKVRITAKPDSDYDRSRTATRRKPDSDPKEAGQQLDEAGHCRPSTWGIRSGLRLDVKPGPLGCRLADAVAVEHETVGVVDEAVEDGIGDGRVRDQLVPVVDRKLTGHDRRTALVPIVDDLQEVSRLIGCDGR